MVDWEKQFNNHILDDDINEFYAYLDELKVSKIGYIPEIPYKSAVVDIIDIDKLRHDFSTHVSITKDSFLESFVKSLVDNDKTHIATIGIDNIIRHMKNFEVKNFDQNLNNSEILNWFTSNLRINDQRPFIEYSQSGNTLFEIDLMKSDEVIIKEFTSKLQEIRLTKFGTPHKKLMTKPFLQKLYTDKVIPCMDLILWAKVNHLKPYTDHQLNIMLFNGTVPDAKIKNTVRKKIQQIINEEVDIFINDE